MMPVLKHMAAMIAAQAGWERKRLFSGNHAEQLPFQTCPVFGSLTTPSSTSAPADHSASDPTQAVGLHLVETALFEKPRMPFTPSVPPAWHYPYFVCENSTDGFRERKLQCQADS
jgi:hypothetical protein